MGIFRGFLRSKERFINYRKLPYFECQFGGFLGEELGERVSPKSEIKYQEEIGKFGKAVELEESGSGGGPEETPDPGMMQTFG